MALCVDSGLSAIRSLSGPMLPLAHKPHENSGGWDGENRPKTTSARKSQMRPSWPMSAVEHSGRADAEANSVAIDPKAKF